MTTGDHMGRSERRPPEPSWSWVSRFQDSPAGDYRTGLEELCRRYWKPVYSYLRSGWSRSRQDAEDLTQAFFLWLLEGEGLKRFAPERGSFRTFLKVLLARFARHELAAAQRLKRGGGRRILPLDVTARGVDETLPDPRTVSPEQVLDRRWVALITDRAMARVRARFQAEGRHRSYRIFEAYELHPQSETPTYASVSELTGLTLSQVREHLYLVRQAVREEIRAELARLTRDRKELEEEWALFRGARRDA